MGHKVIANTLASTLFAKEERQIVSEAVKVIKNYISGQDRLAAINVQAVK